VPSIEPALLQLGGGTPPVRGMLVPSNHGVPAPLCGVTEQPPWFATPVNLAQPDEPEIPLQPAHHAAKNPTKKE